MADTLNKGLIERLEAASGPDRQLDYLIADAVFGKVKPPFQRGHCEKYTASLDAAMTLVPEGHRNNWSLIGFDGLGGPSDLPWQADVADCLADAATPALALCIAALRAQAQEVK